MQNFLLVELLDHLLLPLQRELLLDFTFVRCSEEKDGGRNCVFKNTRGFSWIPKDLVFINILLFIFILKVTLICTEASFAVVTEICTYWMLFHDF